MKIMVPEYYKKFKCIANRCRHTCCKGWEVEINEESLERFSAYPDIMEHVEMGEVPHFRLLPGETCPFLLDSGYCDMILKYGEDILCQTCADHPRFCNYWSDRIEMGLGLVCEEAARIILGSPVPMKLIYLTDSQDEAEEMTEDEAWLLSFRDQLLSQITESGSMARLKEYLIFRHIPDALYDDRLEERIRFVEYFLAQAEQAWAASDGSIDALVELVRELSYDLEYDEEEKERILGSFENEE